MSHSYFRNIILTLLVLAGGLLCPELALSAQIGVAWDANTEPSLAGYKVYFGTSSRAYGSPVNVGKVTNYTLTGLTQGQTYFIAVTAYDSLNNESPYSNEVNGIASGTTQSITVATNPPGLQITVDSTTYTAPKTFNWTAGATHTLSIPSPQSGSSGIRYIYSSWSDGGSQSHTVTAPSSSTTYTANLATQYSLTTSVSPSGSGSASPSGTTWYTSGQTVDLTSTANTGYSFSGWSGSISRTINPAPVTLDGPKSVTANFTAIQYALTVNVNPSASGSVTKNPLKSTYSYGESVTLTASANPGYSFSNWSGDAGGASNPVTITLDGNKSVTANYAALPGSLLVSPSSGLSASGTSGGPFSPSSQIYTLENSGGTLMAWSASNTQNWVILSSTSGSLAPHSSTTITASINSNANALAEGTYTDTVTFSNTTNGSGNTTRSVTLTVSSPVQSYKIATTPPRGLLVDVDGVSYKSPKQFTWAAGSSHTISVNSPQIANASKRYVFSSWSDGGEQSHILVASSSTTTYTASFTTQHSLRTSVYPPEAGVVSVPEITWYDKDQIVSLSAEPNSDHYFTSWSGDTLSRLNPATLVMSRARNMKARFKKVPHSITLEVDPPSAGAISIRPKKKTYVSGEQVTLSAKPNFNYNFLNWSGGISGNLNPCTITVSGDMVIRAGFSAASEPITHPSSADSLPLIGKLESPVDGKSASGIKPIYGWALDGEGIAKVELFIDGAYVCRIPYGGIREDIKESNPTYPHADQSGFAMIWNYSSLSPGVHTMQVKVHNLKGETSDLTAKIKVVKFHGEEVTEISPGTIWHKSVLVTADGMNQTYDVQIQWSDETQDFGITEIIRNE